MTGIERLRKLSEDMLNLSLWVRLTTGTEKDWDCYQGDGRTVNNELLSIANQIEYEMKASSEVEKTKCDPDDVSVSAYDLLPQEDREAIAWVREHGGLGAVKRRWKCLSYYADPVPRSCMEKRLARLQRQIDESHAALRRRNQRIEELNHRAPVLAADGKPLEVGQTVWHVSNGLKFTVVGLINQGDRQVVKLRLSDDGSFTALNPDQLTHQRPVLDADGVPIREGDTVWEVGTVLAIPMTVVEVSRDTVRCEYAWTDGKVYRPCCSPDTLTHAKPEPPDSWKSIEEDAMLSPHSYICACGKYDDAMPKSVQMSIDLVRRCRALAERERCE